MPANPVFVPGVGYVTPSQQIQQGQMVPNQNFLGLSTATLGSLAGGVLANAIKGYVQGGTFPEGSPIDIVPTVGPKRRRRRRKLLTCSDKSDIAYLVGQLGTGQLGRSAISSLLSRRGCG